MFGVTGFGASPITVPVLAHFLPLPFVLSLAAALDLGSAAALGVHTKKQADVRELLVLAPFTPHQPDGSAAEEGDEHQQCDDEDEPVVEVERDPVPASLPRGLVDRAVEGSAGGSERRSARRFG